MSSWDPFASLAALRRMVTGSAAPRPYGPVVAPKLEPLEEIDDAS